jgi:hypothetical protein
MNTRGNRLCSLLTGLCVYPILLALTTAAASATTVNVSVGGGTLTYNVTTVEDSCQTGSHAGGDTIPAATLAYWVSTFSSFSFTLSGVKTSFTTELQQVLGPGTSGNECVTKETPSVTWYVPPAFPFSSQDIITFATSTTEVGEGTASAQTATPGIPYPRYQVQSIIYAAPGNGSSNGFADTLTDGITTSVGSSFAVGDTTTFSVTGGFFGTATLSWSYGQSTTTGNSTADTETISDATGVANKSNSADPNALNHDQDLFIIWINPAVVVYQTGPDSVGYAQGTQLQTSGDPDPGKPEIQDQVEVTAEAMRASASNNNLTVVPVAVLVPQIVDGETLPGLATVCANPTYYPDSCTLANQCGCVPSDFAPILNQDPLLNYTSTESPLLADTSGATACAAPTAADSCRYVPVPSAPGSTVQETELLAGPECTGCNPPVNTFTQTSSNQKTQTLSQSDSYSVGFSWDVKWNFPGGTGISLANAQQWTWTDSESTGEINGIANSMTVTLSSSTVDCYQDIPIFEDTVYHTFVFQQPAGNTSCP